MRTSTIIEQELPGDCLLTVELDIVFTLDPYDPGDRWTPPGGGGIDQCDLTITRVIFTDAKGIDHEIVLFEEQKKLLLEVYESNRSIMERIDDACYHEADLQDQLNLPDYD